MTWDVHLMKAPADAVLTEDVPEGYGPLGRVSDVVERLRSIVPAAWFHPDDGTLPVAWFITDEDDIWGGVDCDSYSLRIYLQTTAQEADPRTPVTAADTVEYVFLAFQPAGDPHRDMADPVWDLSAAACRALECRAEDDGRFLGPDGRPVPVPDTRPKPWWRFWR